MSYCKGKSCSVCGRDRATFNSALSIYLCDKHKHQYRKFGRFLDNNPRTINDLNEINIIDDKAYINLYNSRNEHIYTAIIDKEDYEKVKNYKWRVSIKRTKPYVLTGQTSKTQHLARFVLDYDGELEVDHIDGNVLNNCKSNLRIVSHQDNAKNMKERSNNKFGIRGISYDNAVNMYKVDFAYNNVKFYVKSWRTFEEAVACRYYLELLVNPNRYTQNDDKIAEILKTLSKQQANKIYNYVISKIEEYNKC